MELSLSRVPSTPTTPSSRRPHHQVLRWCTSDRMTWTSSAALSLWLAVAALVCAGLGIGIVVHCHAVVEVRQRYDDDGACSAPAAAAAAAPAISWCLLNVTIPQQMRPPIFFYYQLESFRQNSRRYVRSRSDAQLQGDSDLSENDVASCDPVIADSNDLVYYPCGVIAFTFFNDQFRLSRNGEEFTGDNWQRNGITWPTDPGTKFVAGTFDSTIYTTAVTRDGRNLTLPSVEDEDLMVWMRPAALPSFRKLYSIINSATLEAQQTVSINITNLFVGEDNSNEKTKKFIVLSSRSWIGSKNVALGIIYLSLAVIFALIDAALYFALKYIPPKSSTTKVSRQSNWRRSSK